ncbi:MAG: DUF3014 domain-containing protein [Acidobacteriota bacterium]
MKNKKAVILIVIAIIVLGAAAFYFLTMQSEPDIADEEMVPASSESMENLEPLEEIEPIDVSLDDSDALVRKLVGTLSSYPLVARWLTTDDLIRRFVATVDLVAKGDSPRRPMDFMDVVGDFQTLEMDGKTYIDPAGYRRYDRIAGAIASLDAKGIATLYKQLRLPIQRAYRDMGYPDEDFDETMKKAIFSLLETPIPEGTIYLEKDVMTYNMTDPKLEGLSRAQKHLLRMGPENAQLIQSKLREIVQYLGY